MYLLAQGVHEPLIPKEIAGHVDIPIVHQDSVFLQSRKSMSTAQGTALCGRAASMGCVLPHTYTPWLQEV